MDPPLILYQISSYFNHNIIISTPTNENIKAKKDILIKYNNIIYFYRIKRETDVANPAKTITILQLYVCTRTYTSIYIAVGLIHYLLNNNYDRVNCQINKFFLRNRRSFFLPFAVRILCAFHCSFNTSMLSTKIFRFCSLRYFLFRFKFIYIYLNFFTYR